MMRFRRKNLHAFQFKCLRRILRIIWRAHIGHNTCQKNQWWGVLHVADQFCDCYVVVGLQPGGKKADLFHLHLSDWMAYGSLTTLPPASLIGLLRSATSPSQVRCNSFGRLTALFLHLELAPRHVAESCFFKVSEGFGDCQGERKQISFTFTCLIECHMAASPLCRQLARLVRYEVQHPSQVWCKSFGRPIEFFLHLELALRHFAESCVFQRG